MPRPTTVLGVIEASHSPTLDLTSPFTSDTRTAMHELGHVLGLVGMTNEAVPWFDPRTSRYTERLRAGRLSPALRSVCSLSGVAPWQLALAGLIGDLMTQPPSGGITTISVGALMDIGYPAAWYGAEK